MSSMPEGVIMQPAKEKEQPFLWSQALYIIVRLLSTYVIWDAPNIKCGAYIRECLILMVA